MILKKERKKKVNLVTSSPLGNTRNTSRPLWMKDFSRPAAPCRNPRTVTSCHPRHKRHCPVCRERKGKERKKVQICRPASFTFCYSSITSELKWSKTSESKHAVRTVKRSGEKVDIVGAHLMCHFNPSSSHTPPSPSHRPSAECLLSSSAMDWLPYDVNRGSIKLLHLLTVQRISLDSLGS